MLIMNTMFYQILSITKSAGDFCIAGNNCAWLNLSNKLRKSDKMQCLQSFSHKLNKFNNT